MSEIEMKADARGWVGPDPVFAIFEGGGAKGIAHVGALKAIELAKLVTVGVAGASAGAIVAALKAVGYTADEIFDERGTDILTARGTSMIKLLQRRDWLAFKTAGALGWVFFLLVAVSGFLAFFVVTTVALIARLFGLPGPWRFCSKFSLFTTDRIRGVLNQALRDRLKTHHANAGNIPPHKIPELIRFKDMDPAAVEQCSLLKIVATDYTTGSLRVFDLSDGNVVVADAVAASISIPFFFLPAEVREVDDAGVVTTLPSRFLDGGLISNLPAWVFGEDKRKIERGLVRQSMAPIPIVAFTLDDEGKKPEPRDWWFNRFKTYLQSVVRTAIFGSQATVQQFVEDLTVVPLKSELELLGFDCTRLQACEAYKSARDQALHRLQVELRRRPRTVREILQTTLAEARRRSDVLRHGHGEPPLSRLRAYVVTPFGRHSFRVFAGTDMQLDADDRLILDAEYPGAPEAFRKGRAVLAEESELVDARMTKYERALRWQSQRSVLAVPIFKDEGAPETKVGVLCLDADTSLGYEFDDTQFLEWLSSKSVLLSVALEEVQ
jgi:NTE family protein